MYGNDISHDKTRNYHGRSKGIIGLDLAIILGINVFTLACLYIPNLSGTMARPIVCLIMVLLIPGYSLVAALYPGRKEIDTIERFALSFGLSIAIVPLAGLMANFTPWGIRLAPIIAILTSFNILFALIAFLRRLWLSPDERLSMDVGGIYGDVKRTLIPSRGVPQYLMFLVTAALIIAMGLTLAYFLLAPGRVDSFTEFYILGPDGTMKNYPTDFTLKSEKPVIVAITNNEHKTVNYDLAISLNDITNTMYVEQVRLGDGQTWEKTIMIEPASLGANQKLMFLLYKDGITSAPYRECCIYINVLPPAELAAPGVRGLSIMNGSRT